MTDDDLDSWRRETDPDDLPIERLQWRREWSARVERWERDQPALQPSTRHQHSLDCLDQVEARGPFLVVGNCSVAHAYCPVELPGRIVDDEVVAL